MREPGTTSPSGASQAFFVASTASAYDKLSRQLKSALRHADPDLIPEECRERIGRWQAALPADPTVTAAGFEVHMDDAGRPAGRVDLAVSPGIRSGMTLRDLAAYPGLEALAGPLSELREKAGAPGSRATDGWLPGVPIREVWLEYDLPAAPARSAPGAVQPAWALGPSRSIARDPDRCVELIAALLRAAHGDASPAKLAKLSRTIGRWLSILSAGGAEAYVDYVGLMAGRPDTPVRINVSGTTPEAVLGALGADRALLPLVRSAKRIAFTFDVYESDIGPRRGIELFTAARPLGIPSSEREILAHLAALGMLHPATADALLRWPGSTPVRIPELDAVAAFLFGYGRHYLLRNLNHFKLVFDGAAPAGVKAYLGFGHRWIHGPH